MHGKYELVERRNQHDLIVVALHSLSPPTSQQVVGARKYFDLGLTYMALPVTDQLVHETIKVEARSSNSTYLFSIVIAPSNDQPSLNRHKCQRSLHV